MWVRASTASKKARRTGAVYLHLYAACYGRWLLSKAHPPPSPSGLRFSFWASVPPSQSSFGAPVSTVNSEDVAENFVVDRFSDHDRSRKIARDAGRSLAAPGEADVSGALCVKTMHSHFTTSLRAMGETLGPGRWFSSGSVVGLRRYCPEVPGHRQLDFIGILALCRGMLSRQFP